MEVVQEQEKWMELEKSTIDLFHEETYQHAISDMLAEGRTRLSIDLDDLRKIDPALPAIVINQPAKSIQTIEAVLTNTVKNEVDSNKKATQNYRVTFEGNFGTHYISPRGLKSEFTNKLVRVQGIITRMSLVRPKLMHSKHYCEKTKRWAEKNYTDNYDLNVLQGPGANNSIPTSDPDGNPFSFEYGLSTYKNHQTLTMQELPEKSPTGQLPRSVEVILEEDLVDKVKPGDRVEAVGVYKTINNSSTQNYGVFKTVLIASSIYSLTSEEAQPQLSAEDIRNIKNLAKETDVLDILAASFSPSIYGHDQIKKALILLLLGGSEKNLDNGTHLRGDVNIMLIGDPSTAKSQLLRSVLNIAGLATSTTGRGASGVGLTAAVSRDNETGERQLEAGAMVLADRGVVCIDEFDKMNEVDRVAIHEVMEQQTVTIAKAGIHTSLNARCSVVAAANPLYGTYMQDKSPSWNIALPDSLLSRFDLLFVVLDQKVPEIDRMISERVISNHSNATSGGYDDMDLDNPVIEPMPKEEDEEEEAPVFYQFEGRNLLHKNFLKKYLHYAKKSMSPTLQDDSSSFISQAWANLRLKDEEAGRVRIVPITIRTLETLIRLSTAVAKAYLQPKVEVGHCEVALELMKFAIYQEEEREAAQTLTSLAGSPSKAKKKKDTAGEASKALSAAVSSPTVSEDSKRVVFKTMVELVRNLEMPSASFQELLDAVKSKGIADRDQLLSIVLALDHEGKFMWRAEEQMVFLI